MISSFQNTQWTLVLRASGVGAQAQAALSDLCGAYYAPVEIPPDERSDHISCNLSLRIRQELV